MGSILNQLQIHTEQILNRIQKSGLKSNKDKHVFGETKQTLLGQKISEKGISADTEKVKAIKDMSLPKSQQDLQLSWT